MPSIESRIEIQKERVKLLLQELEEFVKKKNDIDVIIDIMTTKDPFKRQFEIYAGLYEAYKTISTFSSYLGLTAQATEYENMAQTTVDALEKIKSVGA